MLSSVNVVAETYSSNRCSLPIKSGETVYLIGAGGCGMSALGHILLDLGCRVAGSDICQNKNTEQLIHRGAKIFIGHSAENIKSINPALVVYTSAIGSDNPELRAASSTGTIPLFRRGEFLATVVNQTDLVCVAGMHGKTTTSALLAYAFESLGCSYGYSVGWNVPQLPRNGKFNLPGFSSQQQNSRTGRKTAYFVIEADESDGTLNLFEPLHSIILNIDREHLDYFGSFERLKREFLNFAEKTRGTLVYCADDPILAKMIGKSEKSHSYGFSESAEYKIELIGENPSKKGFTFEVYKHGKSLGRFTNALFGAHNVLNSSAAIALLDLIGFSYKEISPIIGSFKGAERRQEELLNEKIRVFDDYGHHPNEIRATINAIKPLCSNKLLVVFQPHRYTRTRDLYVEFGKCFSGANRVWVMDIYGAGEKPIPGITSKLIVDEILKNGIESESVSNVDEVCKKVLEKVAVGDVVLFCGAGADVTVAAHRFAEIVCSKRTRSDGTPDCDKPSDRRLRNLILV